MNSVSYNSGEGSAIKGEKRIKKESVHNARFFFWQISAEQRVTSF